LVVKSGDSISLQCRFGKGEDVCTVNAEGTENGYMVNTFSVPDAVISLRWTPNVRQPEPGLKV
jgi:hypothetical protein